MTDINTENMYLKSHEEGDNKRIKLNIYHTKLATDYPRVKGIDYDII